MALGRAVQLARITNGLYTPRQLPILRKRVENAANRGDWKAVLNQIMELYSRGEWPQLEAGPTGVCSWLTENPLKVRSTCFSTSGPLVFQMCQRQWA
ncbi:MAG: hypothetical protein IIB72_00945 [Proteobacteria bacterium]|nr:hypothetical protein [Pseudomonadota bacterium]